MTVAALFAALFFGLPVYGNGRLVGICTFRQDLSGKKAKSIQDTNGFPARRFRCASHDTKDIRAVSGLAAYI